MPKTVFISYAQAPAAHKQRVADLAASLQRAGLRVLFDQEVTSPQGPPEGWPKWMLNQIEQADWVLVICNEPYYRRFRGKEDPGRGLGAHWEGAVIGQTLYSNGMLNHKFIPVLLADEPTAHIPEPLRGASYYQLPTDLGKLTAALTGGPPAVPVPSDPVQEDKPPSATRDRRRTPSSQPESWRQIAPFAVVSLGCFLGALILIALMLWKADLLAKWQLTGPFYYLVLLPLGLMAAGFLFGVLRSYARYSGRHFGGVVELGGPVVLFALTIVGGFVLPRPVANFPLTVYVHGEGGPQNLILRNQGSVLLQLGGYPRSERIGDKGQAIFPEIPASFRDQLVTVLLDADGFEPTEPGRQYPLHGNSLYLPVRKKPGHLTGRVEEYRSNKPLPGVHLELNVSVPPAISDATGRFELTIPGYRLRDDLTLRAVAPGYQVWENPVVVGSNDIVVILIPKP